MPQNQSEDERELAAMKVQIVEALDKLPPTEIRTIYYITNKFIRLDGYETEYTRRFIEERR